MKIRNITLPALFQDCYVQVTRKELDKLKELGIGIVRYDARDSEYYPNAILSGLSVEDYADFENKFGTKRGEILLYLDSGKPYFFWSELIDRNEYKDYLEDLLRWLYLDKDAPKHFNLCEHKYIKEFHTVVYKIKMKRDYRRLRKETEDLRLKSTNI